MCLKARPCSARTANGAHARFIEGAVHTLVALPDKLSFETGAAIRAHRHATAR